MISTRIRLARWRVPLAELLLGAIFLVSSSTTRLWGEDGDAVADDAVADDAVPDDVVVDLRPRFVQGQTLYLSANQSAAVKLAGQSTKTQSVIEQSLAVHTVGKESADATLRYEAASLEQTIGSRRIFADSRNDGDANQSPGFRQMLASFVGKSMEVRYGLDGTVQEVAGRDALKKTRAAPFLQIVDDAVFQRMLSGFVAPPLGRASDRSFDRSSVKVGETWTVEEKTSFGPGIELTIALEYSLEKVTAEEATIRFSGSGKFTTTDESKDLAPRLEKHTKKGVIVWNRKERRLKSYESSTVLSMYNRAADGSELPFQLDEKRSVKVTRVVQGK